MDSANSNLNQRNNANVAKSFQESVSEPLKSFASSIDNPLHKLNDVDVSKTIQENVAEPLKTFANDPVGNINAGVEKSKRTAAAAQNVARSTFDPTYKPHSVAAQKLVLAKGFFDVFLSFSLIFFPSLLYDGPIPKAISLVTTLSKADWEKDTSSAYALSSLIMGAGFAGIVAGESTSDDAYKVVAALNGVFALMGLIGSILHPHKYGSSFLLLACLQDVFWFFAIVRAGNYGVMETLGFPTKRIKEEADKMAGQAARRYASDEAQGVVEGSVRGVTNEGQRALNNNPFAAPTNNPFNPVSAKD